MNQNPSLSDFLSLRYAAGGHPLTQLLSQRAGAVLAFVAYRLGWSPSAVTLLGLVTSIGAACLYATLPPGWEAALTCLLLLQLAYALDCADGQLARAANRASSFGAWLDLACDYIRDIALTAAVLLWLLQAGVTLEVALGACGLQLAGMVVHLHTVTVLRQVGARPQPAAPGLAGLARTLATSIFDIATVLLVLALLRPAPALLLPYCAFVGMSYGLMTFVVVRRHLASGQP